MSQKVFQRVSCIGKGERDQVYPLSLMVPRDKTLSETFSETFFEKLSRHSFLNELIMQRNVQPVQRRNIHQEVLSAVISAALQFSEKQQSPIAPILLISPFASLKSECGLQASTTF